LLFGKHNLMDSACRLGDATRFSVLFGYACATHSHRVLVWARTMVTVFVMMWRQVVTYEVGLR
jgi:hypothetical protein